MVGPRHLLLAAALAVAAPAVVVGQTPDSQLQEGRRKAAACQTCHGLDGMGRLPDAPHLAAQPAPYLERALRAYRSGERKHEVMNVAARSLSDDDIRALAAYFAAVRIEVKAVPE